MKISPLNSGSFMQGSPRPAHHSTDHGSHAPHAPHAAHSNDHPGGVHRAEHAHERPDCHEDRSRSDRRDRSCDSNLRYDEYLNRQNRREHDRFESCRHADRPQHYCEPTRYEKPSCNTGRANECGDTREPFRMPKVGDVTQTEFNRAIERAVETYLIQTLTAAGSRIDFFA